MDGEYLNPQMQICSGLTLASFGILFVTYTLNPDLRKLVYVEMIFYEILSCACAGIGYMMGPTLQNYTWQCWFQGIVVNYFTLASVFWIVIVAFQLNKIVNKGKIVKNLRKGHLFCWGFPLIPTFLPLCDTRYMYGKFQAQGFCMVSPVDDENSNATINDMWTILTMYAWIWFAIIAVFALLCKVVYKFHQQGSHVSKQLRQIVYVLGVYPVVLVICWTVSTIHRCMDLLHQPEPPFWFHLMGNTFPVLQGFFMTIILFATSEKTRYCFYNLFYTVGDGEDVEFDSGSASHDRRGMLAKARSSHGDSILWSSSRWSGGGESGGSGGSGGSLAMTLLNIIRNTISMNDTNKESDEVDGKPSVVITNPMKRKPDPDADPDADAETGNTHSTTSTNATGTSNAMRNTEAEIIVGRPTSASVVGYKYNDAYRSSNMSDNDRWSDMSRDSNIDMTGYTY